MNTTIHSIARKLPAPIKSFAKALRALWREHTKQTFVQRMLAGQELDIGEVESLIRPVDGVVIDVGAERGEISRHFARKGFQVHAFEPSSANRKLFFRFCFGQVLAGRVHLHPEALSDKEGSVNLSTSGHSWSHSIVFDAGVGDTEKVRTLRLSTWIQGKGLPKVSFLKVDAEGHDLQVLRGYFEKPGVPFPKILMVEFNKSSLPELYEYLKAHGYRYFRFIGRIAEKKGLQSQIRLIVCDGMNRTVAEAGWGNIVCSGVDPFP